MDSEPPVETIVTPQDLVDAAVDSAAAAAANIDPPDTPTNCKAAMRQRSRVRVAARSAAKQLEAAAKKAEPTRNAGRPIGG
jgi:hypothetical protein